MNRENEKAMFAGKNKSGLTKMYFNGRTGKEVTQKQHDASIKNLKKARDDKNRRIRHNKIANEVYDNITKDMSDIDMPNEYVNRQEWIRNYIKWLEKL